VCLERKLQTKAWGEALLNSKQQCLEVYIFTFFANEPSLFKSGADLETGPR